MGSMLMMMLSTTIMGKEQPANHALTVVAATKDYGSSIPHQTHTRKTDDGGKEDGTNDREGEEDGMSDKEGDEDRQD